MTDTPTEPEPLRFFCISLFYHDSPTPDCRNGHWEYDSEEKFARNWARLIKRHGSLVKKYKARLIGEEAIDGKWVEIAKWEKA